MALLSASNLTKAYGTDVLFTGVSFEVRERERIGLVGCNGSGKTTLFQLLTDEVPADSGEIFRAKETILGYMQQHVCREPEVSALAETMQVFAPLIRMEQELEYLSQQLQGHSALAEPELHGLIEKQAHLNETFLAQGGLTFRSRVRSALLGLGFDESQMALPVMSLSGGQKAKLQLAKLLLSGANLLLLDEPTNHLDLASVEWLEDFLKAYPGAFLVISHDRYFLDRITTRTLELEQRKLWLYPGNYSSSRVQRQERVLTEQREYEKQQAKMDKMRDYVRKNLAASSSTNSVGSRVKALEKLEREHIGLERPQGAAPSMRVAFPIRNRGGNDVLKTSAISLQIDGTQIFHKVSLEIQRGERVFLIGPNGCGKTSLFKTLLGEIPASGGEQKFGAGIEPGYYDQAQERLDLTKTVLDEVWDAYPSMTQGEVRSALAVFLFRGEEVFKPVSALSGGERARVLLLKLMLSQANFLLLDEPTNHLDLDSCEALEQALQGYEGTLLIISHDRYFINKLATKIYDLTPDGTVLYQGNYDEYLARVKTKTEEPLKEQAPQKQKDYQLRKEAQAEKRKARAALARLEDEIEHLEGEITQTEEQLAIPEIATDYAAALELTKQLDALRTRLEEAMLSWEEQSERVEALHQE